MIKTIKLKNLTKYLVGLIVTILITVGSTRFFSSLYYGDKHSFFNINFKNILESTICIANYNKILISKEEQKYSSRSRNYKNTGYRAS